MSEKESIMRKKRNSIRNLSNMLLLITSIIWGFAFIAQSIGMNYIGPWTFVFARFILAAIILVPVTVYSEKLYRNSDPRFHTKNENQVKEYKRECIFGGALTGFFLGLASITQQIGIQKTSAGKAGFITALYVILVPILGIFLKKMPQKKIWICAALALLGLYRISMKDASFNIGSGDLYVIVCAFVFSFQIISIDHYSARVNPVLLANIQFLFAATVGFVGMIVFEKWEWNQILNGIVPVLYAGILSSAVGYTLQTLCQRHTDPSIASLIMSLESVFSALGGFLILKERMTFRELSGCAFVFAAVLIAQIDIKKKSSASG